MGNGATGSLGKGEQFYAHKLFAPPPRLDAIRRVAILNRIFVVMHKEMATHLFVSENTVKFHLKHIYSKLNVSSRLQAIAKARDLGLIN